MANQEDSSLQVIEQKMEHLVAGMELARDVVTQDGKVLASKGAVLSRHTINKFKQWDIEKAYIISEAPPDLVLEAITDPVAQKFMYEYKQSVDKVKKSFDDVRRTREVSLENFSATAGNLAENIAAAGNVVDLLYTFSKGDDDVYRHSVNVSVIAALIATWLKLPPETISAISMTGLLHDIGKTQVSPAILQRVNNLSELEEREYQKHSLFGFELIRQLPNVAQSIARGVLEHHEYIDGSGYPYGLKEDKIHPYAQIIAVANLYDNAMTIRREQDIVVSPYLGLEHLWKEIHRLNPRNSVVFRDHMINLLSGNMVMLTDGRKGKVIVVSKDTPSRSIVQLEGGTVLNLAEEKNLLIHYVLR
jgi:putative nucleotidyltransferase with HDIG domain